MQKKLQYLVFASFILCLTTISYASVPMLYFVDKLSNKLNVCNINKPSTLNNCRTIFTVPYINSVAVSPDGHNVFFSTESNEVYGCIREDDGSLSSCKPHTSTFSNPQGMAFDRTHYLYIANEGNNSISVCKFTNHGEIYGCHTTGTIISSPVSIAISFDDEFAYIASPETNSVVVCQITSNLKFRGCTYVQKAEYFRTPISVSADPLQKYIYILDEASIHGGVSCPLINFTQKDGTCRVHPVDPFNHHSTMLREGSAMDVVPHYKEGSRSVSSFVAVKTGINFCSIISGEYNCQVTSAQGYGFIGSVAYAKKDNYYN